MTSPDAATAPNKCATSIATMHGVITNFTDLTRIPHHGQWSPPPPPSAATAAATIVVVEEDVNGECHDAPTAKHAITPIMPGMDTGGTTMTFTPGSEDGPEAEVVAAYPMSMAGRYRSRRVCANRPMTVWDNAATAAILHCLEPPHLEVMLDRGCCSARVADKEEGGLEEA